MNLRMNEKPSSTEHSRSGGGEGGLRGQHSERSSQMSSHELSQHWMFPIY